MVDPSFTSNFKLLDFSSFGSSRTAVVPKFASFEATSKRSEGSDVTLTNDRIQSCGSFMVVFLLVAGECLQNGQCVCNGRR